MSGVDVYFSTDVEADGPIPGPYSMVSFGMAVCGTFDGESGSAIVASTKRFMPEHLFGNRPHSHNALDDAREQGELLQNLMRWEGRR